MGGNSFSEISSKSWVSRIGGAAKGILFGLFLFIISFPLLFWNEGRAVKTYKTLKEGAGAVVSISSDVVDPSLNGKLVHLSGLASTSQSVSDPLFGQSANALKLARTVEMYQWREHQSSETKSKLGGGSETKTTIDYKKEWSESLLDSSQFKHPEGHINPGDLPYQSEVFNTAQASVGAFKLNLSLLGMINSYEDFNPDLESVPAELKSIFKKTTNGLYRGADPSSPQVGDIRVTFSKVSPAVVSIIAAQSDLTFEPYLSQAGGSIELLELGEHSAAAMFKTAQTQNSTLTWILRLVGFFIMFFGLSLMMRPMVVLADVMPILGGLASVGTGLMAGFAAAILSLLTIAVAWLFYRPLLALGLGAGVVGLFLLMVRVSRKRILTNIAAI